MKSFAIGGLVLAGIALIAVTGFAGPASAQSVKSAHATTPKNWNYEIKDGKRVPKSNRVANADGSWREELKQGPCVQIKEGTATGEVKITRRCD
jgi:hypothetical protein